MSSRRDCIYGRTIGCILWHRRYDLHLQLEDVARASGLSIGRILDTELAGDDDEAIELLCRALELNVGLVLAQAQGHLLAHYLPAPWDEPLQEQDGDGFPF